MARGRSRPAGRPDGHERGHPGAHHGGHAGDDPPGGDRRRQRPGHRPHREVQPGVDLLPLRLHRRRGPRLRAPDVGRPSGQLRGAPRPGREPLRPGPGGRRAVPGGPGQRADQGPLPGHGGRLRRRALRQGAGGGVRAVAGRRARRRCAGRSAAGRAPGCRSTTWRSRSAPCSSGWSCWARRRTTAATPTASSPPSRVWPGWATWPSPRSRRCCSPRRPRGRAATPRPRSATDVARTRRAGQRAAQPPGQARQPA